MNLSTIFRAWLIAIFGSVVLNAQVVPKENVQHVLGTGNYVGTNSGALLFTTPPQTVNTIAALRATAIVGMVNGTQASVAGYYAAADGGGGPVRVLSIGNPPGTYTDNGGSIIVPTGGNGSAAWLFTSASSITPLMFGAAGNGTTDDTINIQGSIIAAIAIRSVLVIDRTYRITTALVIPASLRVQGMPGGQIIYDGAGGAYPLNHAIVCQSTVAVTVTKIIAGSTPAFNTAAITMTSGEIANFTAGDNVFVAYGVDKYDADQPHYGFFTTVVSAIGTTLTLTDGLPEASSVGRVSYSGLSGGTFSAGNTITQGSASAKIGMDKPTTAYGNPLLTLTDIVGHFSAGSITNGTATATLAAPFAGASSVDASYSVMVQKLSSVAERIALDGLDIEYTFNGGTVCSGAVCMNQARNCSISNLRVRKNTVGVALLFTTDIAIENLYCDSLSAGSGPVLAKAIGGWNQINTHAKNIYAKTDREVIFLESQCRSCIFENVTAYRVGSDTGTPVIAITQGNRGIRVNNTKIISVPACPILQYLGVFTDMDTDFTYTDMEIGGNYSSGIPTANVAGKFVTTFTGSRVVYNDLRTFTAKFVVSPASTPMFTLPNGLYRRMRLYYSTDIGITQCYLVGTVGSESGQGDPITNMPPPAGGGWVTCPSYVYYTPGNRGIGPKSLIPTTDGSWPVGGYLVIDAEYWPNPSEAGLVGPGQDTPQAIRSGASTPNGSITPRFIGDTYTDNTNGAAYVASSLANTGWVPAGNFLVVSNVNIPSATPTKIATMTRRGTYMVVTYLDVNSYNAYAIVSANTAGGIEILAHGGAPTYSMSGEDLMITQASGVPSTVNKTTFTLMSR